MKLNIVFDLRSNGDSGLRLCGRYLRKPGAVWRSSQADRNVSLGSSPVIRGRFPGGRSTPMDGLNASVTRLTAGRCPSGSTRTPPLSPRPFPRFEVIRFPADHFGEAIFGHQ
jgi:hypothetical protein